MLKKHLVVFLDRKTIIKSNITKHEANFTNGLINLAIKHKAFKPAKDVWGSGLLSWTTVDLARAWITKRF